MPIYESKLVNLSFGKKMKLVISIIILLTLNVCAKEKKYLSEYDARVHLNNGGSLFCEDTSTKKIVVVDRRWSGVRIAGMSFYNKGKETMTVTKCTFER